MENNGKRSPGENLLMRSEVVKTGIQAALWEQFSLYHTPLLTPTAITLSIDTNTDMHSGATTL